MPAPATPQGQHRRFSDKQLRADLQAGMKAADIAAKHGVSRSAVSQRVKQIGLTTAVAAVQPYEARRHVRRSIDAMEELGRSLHSVNLLMEACDEWLRVDPDVERYDVGPRADEVSVVYSVEVQNAGRPGTHYEKRRAPLDQLLAAMDGLEHFGGEKVASIDKSEFKHADPRELILKTCAETRQTVGECASLVKMLADSRTMALFRDVTLQEIAKVAPEVAERIAEAVRRSIVLQGLLDGGPIFSGGDPGAAGGERGGAGG